MLSVAKATVAKEGRIWATVDWRKAPEGAASGVIRIKRDNGHSVEVKVSITNPTRISEAEKAGCKGDVPGGA